MLLTCVELFLDRLQPDNDDQRAHAMSPCCKPVLGKISRNLAVAKERVRCKNLIDLVHQIDDQLVLSSLHRPVRLRSVCSLRIISRRSDRLIATALVTKIISHRQLTNPGVKLFDLASFSSEPF